MTANLPASTLLSTNDDKGTSINSVSGAYYLQQGSRSTYKTVDLVESEAATALDLLASLRQERWGDWRKLPRDDFLRLLQVEFPANKKNPTSVADLMRGLKLGITNPLDKAVFISQVAAAKRALEPYAAEIAEAEQSNFKGNVAEPLLMAYKQGTKDNASAKLDAEEQKELARVEAELRQAVNDRKVTTATQWLTHFGKVIYDALEQVECTQPFHSAYNRFRRAKPGYRTGSTPKADDDDETKGKGRWSKRKNSAAEGGGAAKVARLDDRSGKSDKYTPKLSFDDRKKAVKDAATAVAKAQKNWEDNKRSDKRKQDLDKAKATLQSQKHKLNRLERGLPANELRKRKQEDDDNESESTSKGAANLTVARLCDPLIPWSGTAASTKR